MFSNVIVSVIWTIGQISILDIPVIFSHDMYIKLSLLLPVYVTLL